MEQRSGLDSALKALVDRLRALRSAWGVLAPSSLSTEKADIAEAGRTLNDDLMELVSRAATDPDFEAMAEIESRLDHLESEMRAVAFKISVTQLRSTLPDFISQNRRGVLDLLDLMLGAELRGESGTEARIPSIDYLITLLCSAGPDRPPLDPVQLTPRLHELCERSGVDYDPRLPEIEAEFFHAADMYEADSREEMQLRALRTRKTELGPSYFAPQVLRAIVTYNVALLQRIDEAVLASQDWGMLPPVADEPLRTVSVFDSHALPELAQALRRRVTGKAPELSAVDRIAWCLDLEYPNAEERQVLLAETTDAPADLTRMVILVGLMCRASVVLEDEFPAIGVTSSQLFEEWVPELSEALQQKVNRGISDDDYREACLLSELKSRYLYASMAEMRRVESSGPMPTPKAIEAAGTLELEETMELAEPPGAAETADSIMREAILDSHRASQSAERLARKALLNRRLVTIGVALAVALLALWIGRGLLFESDQMRFNRDQLDQVSPFLSYGARNGNGRGPAFVGEIRDGWSALQLSDRILVVTDLVETLREAGVRDVMIYDDDGFLRIQA
ncbi:MAG: hypothetical protein JRE43_09995, partial [Deltaproteobacteria bacterium]|nr:hypothetical protein [Deltaproteobacteria bacterium]